VAVGGFILTAAFGLFLRDHPKSGEPEVAKRQHRRAQDSELKRLGKVCRARQNWLVGAYCFFAWAPISVFAALWGVPYMMSTFHISEPHAAMDVSTIWIGVAIGGPLLGWWSNVVHSRRLPLIIASVSGLIGSFCILYVYFVPEYIMDVFFFMLGVAGSSQAVGFGLVKDNNPPDQAGTAAGLNNMLILLGGATLQPLVGELLSFGWTGTITPSGVQTYPIEDYQLSLAIMPICYAISFVLSSLYVNETHGEPIYQI
jgi:MFS family permease